jgi:lysophosphatidylglycerol acyltransferase 1
LNSVTMETRTKEVFVRWSKYVARTLWVLVNNIYVIPTHVVILTLFSPLAYVLPELFYLLEETMFTWMLSMVSCWIWSAGYTILESGDSLDQSLKGRILFMPNHQSTADVPFLMTLFTPRFGLAGRVMWLMDKVFKYTNFGICSWIHDDFFIQAGKLTRDQSLVELREHLTRVFHVKNRDCLVLFPEGGFLRKRKAVSQSFAKKHDLPQFDHVTVPRTGALKVIMDVLGPDGSSPLNTHIDQVVDVTIAYPEGKPLDLVSIITGWRPPCTSHVHYRVFDVKELPADSDELFKWMVSLYQDKERMLDEFYRTGEFPHTMFNPGASTPKPVKHCAIRYTLLNLIFFFACLSLCLMFYSLVSLFV